MNPCRSVVTALLALVLPLYAQEKPDAAFELMHQAEERRAASLMQLQMRTAAQNRPIDVKYYGINVRLAGPKGFLSGDVVMTAVASDASVSAFTLDLSSSMTVDSVILDGRASSFQRTASGLVVTPPLPILQGSALSAHIYYHGQPPNTGLGSYTDTASPNGRRWIYTLSEPYGARDWWPCIDHPSEKADSLDMAITCDSSLAAVSNGLLVSDTKNGDGTRTFFWKHRYPIAPYLVAVTVGDFSQFTDYYRYAPADSMPVVNYVLTTTQQRTPDYRANAALTPRMLAVYASIMGQYPFIKEKYGHVEFGWGGGMEHQTLTSLGSRAFTEGTIAHELAHQWFGDMITCRTWQDLWLNEGFAQYFEAVWRERQYGKAAYLNLMQSRAAANGSGAKSAPGSLFVQDTANVNNLFATSRVYNKGSWVLHMLRHAVGDSLFFASIRAYADDPALRYGTASSGDFRRNVERVTGRDLGWFFSEWVYGERYPRYTYTLSSAKESGAWRASVRIQQSTGTANPAFFTMPIDLKFFGASWDTTVTVFNSAGDETFQFLLSRAPDSLQFDPEQWILRDVVRGAAGIVDAGNAPASYRLLQNYPNPFNPSTVIAFSVPEKSRVTIRLYDVMGREVAVLLDEEKEPGTHTLPFDASGLASGVYLYRMNAVRGQSVFTQSRKLLLMR